MTIKDGGPAFPQKEPLTNDWHGMTLRDHFAGLALQGMLSDSLGINEDTGKKFNVPDDADLIAFCCYKMADAMIRAREVTA